VEKEIIPALRRQKGFLDEIAFVHANGEDVFSLSLWDGRADADAYGRGAYSEVTKLLKMVVEGEPEVETFEVCNSTFHTIRRAGALESGPGHAAASDAVARLPEQAHPIKGGR
jgi:hypothetical protein